MSPAPPTVQRFGFLGVVPGMEAPGGPPGATRGHWGAAWHVGEHGREPLGAPITAQSHHACEAFRCIAVGPLDLTPFFSFENKRGSLILAKSRNS
ncbi:hypothetical protein CGMCC3_g8221 [Colletotrichum fructicola]|nr:uncharacterized protein CGMCC3_g8221 [Colletotrichum fructicola]KAE9575883.1 hypothetical protein CGMCC3_g8221 [Colletotrichum fructicola]